MADKKISALTAASTPLAGTEVLPIVQSGSTVKVAVSNLTAGRDVSATSITAGLGLVGTPAYTFTGDTNTGMWSPAADTVAVSTAGAERMCVSSAGFVGIGTSAPGTILDVRTAAGSGPFLTFVNTSATANANVIETGYTLNNANTGSSMVAVIGATNPFAVGNTYGDIYFKTQDPTNGLTEKMRINSAGDVSIAATGGLFSSANRGNLTIGGSSSSILVLGTGTGTAAYLYSDRGTSQCELWNIANGFMRFGTNNTERLRLDTSGNVLVGTTSDAGVATNTTKLIGGIFATVRSSLSVASATPTTIVTLPSGDGIYIVSTALSASTDPANYNETAIVSISGSTSSIAILVNASVVSLTMSGLNLQVTQNQGATQTMQFSVLRIL